MKQEKSSAERTIRWVHEAMFSLNLALVIVAFSLEYGSELWASGLIRLEFYANKLFHVRQTDFIRGYWEFFLPGIGLALCIWGLLRLFSHSRLTGQVLRSAAGFAAVGAPCVWWLCATYLRTHKYGWSPSGAIQSYELAVALCWVILYLYSSWRFPRWGGIVMLLLHYTFWLWQFWPLLVMFVRGWGASAAVTVVVGLCSSLAWMLYVTSPAQNAAFPQIHSDLTTPS